LSEKNKNAAVKIIISGFVQGVGYRYFIHRNAEELGLKGYAKNLFNGDVEIEAEGRKEILEELISRTKSGPSRAKVTDCKVEWLEFKNKYHDFNIY
jgi:acylphosphatase